MIRGLNKNKIFLNDVLVGFYFDPNIRIAQKQKCFQKNFARNEEQKYQIDLENIIIQ